MPKATLMSTLRYSAGPPITPNPKQRILANPGPSTQPNPQEQLKNFNDRAPATTDRTKYVVTNAAESEHDDASQHAKSRFILP